ncbi:MAG: hypothetical protein BWY73_00474 [candidate division TA06 bacterium ADurb.Bin417]|uniref:Tetratricopeptide repeat protein n=1 Tax=candidate division TA06 bacterium ADurb.Bin417 TaxID=1852828 RepID=A0A1V5MJ56_UNCT6|nr:MAG: hypothetical protein BWY73_00474 [candidate division TA06 bacterium ADurb.Bin417]
MKLLKFALAGLVGFLFLCGPHPASGADSRDPAIAAGQAALKQGMEAAKRKNWPLAVKRYTEAQKRIHLSPQIMHNLALAHAQMGNELLADVWFRAYLGAVPQAANADEVRAEIARLEKAADDKVQLLFKQAEDLAELLPIQGESQLDITGRRAAAFVSIYVSRHSIGDFKGADEDYAKIIKYQISKNLYRERNSESSPPEHLSAKTLAEAGDIEGALRLRDQEKSDYYRKELTSDLCFVILFAGDVEKAAKMAEEENIRLDEFDNHWFAEAFARKGDYAKAAVYAKKARREATYLFIAESHLSRGNISEAIRYARLSGDEAVGMAIRGEVNKAFQDLMAAKPSVVSPYSRINDFNDIAKNLVRLGDMQNARKATELAAEWARRNFPRDDYAAGLALRGKAYFEVGAGKADEAIKQMNKGLRLTNVYNAFRNGEIEGTRKGTEIECEEQRAEWQRDLCDFAVSRGKPEAAEKIADSFTESRERIEFLRQVLAAYESKNDRANAERLTKKLTGLLAEVQAGWDPENLGREIVVNAWTDAAYKLSEETALCNLPACISEIKKNRSPDEMPCYIAFCAAAIGKGLLKIRFMDRIYR